LYLKWREVLEEKRVKKLSSAPKKSEIAAG